MTTGSLPLRLSRDLGFYLRSQRASDRRFKQATGWSPRLTARAPAGGRWSPSTRTARAGKSPSVASGVRKAVEGVNPAPTETARRHLGTVR
ncbi:hypothetical protein Airi01_031310 [Actinoallomurus iriomotensis]|uniref:Uncharacterized protein n=1 Tax=Actinoallomurus iriomotensis TaxID=478107 RepID=A0A9W6RFY4_9ACTN|nr:hypothetical protein Airi01_031310 [Actinoallomurus iriomotensis]